MRFLFYLVAVSFLLLVRCDNPFLTKDINKPENLTLDQAWDGIEITWDDNNDYEDGYDIFRNNQKIATLEPDETEYLDHSFSPFEPLAYYVSCFKDGGESEDTDKQNISIALKFYDRFTNSISSVWYKTPEATILTYSNGEMNINGDDSDEFQHNAYFYEDIQTPFTFGAKMRKISGGNSATFGIGVRSESTDARIFIFISGSQRLRVMEFQEEWRDLITPVNNNSINSNGSNEIRFCVDQDKFKAFINGEEVCLMYYSFSDYADCFYLYTQEDLSVNFDDVYLFQN